MTEEVGGLTIAGGMILPSLKYPKTIGTQVLHWFGDQLPRQTGEIPPGYISGPYYKQWIRGRHSTSDWFSIGPYEVLPGNGEFQIKLFMIAPVGARTSGQNAFYVDVFDFSALKILASKTFSVSELPQQSDAFAVLSVKTLPVISDHKYETRVRAEGGADLYIYLLHWEVALV